MIRPDTLVFRTLTAMARQRRELGEARCDAVVQLLQTGFVIHRALQRQLEEAGLTELKFAVLVALFALDPSPVTTTDLAYYTGFTRSAATKAVAGLSAHRLVVTERDAADRRVLYLRLTPPGRRLSEKAALGYLGTISRMTLTLQPAALAALRHTCARLAGGVSRLSPLPLSP